MRGGGWGADVNEQYWPEHLCSGCDTETDLIHRCRRCGYSVSAEPLRISRESFGNACGQFALNFREARIDIAMLEALRALGIEVSP